MRLPIMQYKYIDVYNLQFDFVKADYFKKYICIVLVSNIKSTYLKP